MEEKDVFSPEWIEKHHVNTIRLSDCIEQREYYYQAEQGTIYLCRPWRGLSVWANEVSMSSLPCDSSKTNYPFVKLNYCTEGRCEVLLENGKYVYLGAGMLSIDCNYPKESFRYPSKIYEGLEVVLNPLELEPHLAQVLKDLNVGVDRQEELRQHNQGSFLAGVSREWDMLAKTIIKRLKEGDGSIEDFRFLSLKLLYLLGCGHTFPLKQVYVTKGQRQIAEAVEQRIVNDLRHDYTVEQMAKESGVSPSSLKKYFDLVYGSPISEYVRQKRMERACQLLRQTDMSIGDVAEEVGYAHQGKFGGAFKKYANLTPLEYRRRNRERST